MDQASNHLFVCVCTFLVWTSRSALFRILPHMAALRSAPWRFGGLSMSSVTISKEHERESWLRIQSRNLLLASLPYWTSGDWLDGIFAPKAAVPLKVPFPYICPASLLRTSFIICLRVMKSPELGWATEFSPTLCWEDLTTTVSIVIKLPSNDSAYKCFLFWDSEQTLG